MQILELSAVLLAGFFGGILTNPVTELLQAWMRRREILSALQILTHALPSITAHNINAVKDPDNPPAEIIAVVYPTHPFENALFGTQNIQMGKETREAIIRYWDKANELNVIIVALQTVHFEQFKMHVDPRNTARRFLLSQLDRKADRDLLPQRIDELKSCLEKESNQSFFSLVRSRKQKSD